MEKYEDITFKYGNLLDIAFYTVPFWIVDSSIITFMVV